MPFFTMQPDDPFFLMAAAIACCCCFITVASICHLHPIVRTNVNSVQKGRRQRQARGREADDDLEAAKALSLCEAPTVGGDVGDGDAAGYRGRFGRP